MLSMSWRPFCEVVTARLVPGQIIMLPPRSSLRVAARAPAAMDDPLITFVPEFARTTEPFTLASEANNSPTVCWADTGPVAVTTNEALNRICLSAELRGNCDIRGGGIYALSRTRR